MGLNVGKLIGKAAPVIITGGAGLLAGLIVKEGGKLASKATAKALADKPARR